MPVPAVTCGADVTFVGARAPNVVVDVAEALRVFSAVPSSIVATVEYVPAVLGKTRTSSVPLEPFGSVPTFQVTLPLAPMAGAVVSAVAPMGRPPKGRPAGRRSVTVTVVPVAWPMFE